MARRYGRKRTFRRRKFVRRTRGTRRIRRVVKRTLWRNAETKFLVGNIVNSNINANYTGELSWYQGLALGTQFNQRIGNKIHTKCLTFRLNFTFQQGVNGVNSGTFRVLILYPRKGVDTATLTAYLTTAVPGMHGRADPRLFMTLYDKNVTLQSTAYNASSGGNTYWRQLRYYKRCNYIMNYQDDNSVDREPIIYFASTVPNADPSAIYMNGYLCMAFKDF